VSVQATTKYGEAMIRRGVSITTVLALCAIGGMLFAGCGGGTQTVTISSAPPPATTGFTAHTTSTPAPTTSTPASPPTATTGTGTQSATNQGTSTTRTAPAPAFTGTDGQSTTGATSTAATAAAAVVRAQGYTPNNTSDYHPNQTLRVLVGTRTGTADGYDQRAFFFLGGHYLGTDSSQPSASVRVVGQSDTEVILAYSLYRPKDSLCCPSGGQDIVHFQLDNGTLTPLQTLPPASSSAGLSRQ
jgi:hypothetical protein